MTTGDRYVNISNKRLMGTQDFRERFLEYLIEYAADIHRTAYGLDGVFGGVPITLSNGAHGADKFQLDNDANGSDGDGHFLFSTADLSGRGSSPFDGVQFENLLSVEKIETISITGTTAGLYRYTANGEDHDYNSPGGETTTQIRDALLLAIQAGGQDGVIFNAASSGAADIIATATFPGDTWASSVSGPGGPDIVLAATQAPVDNNYDVALHYAVRPREVQINPRLGQPEYVSFEETIGFAGEPNAVSDMGGGVLEFNIDDVCEPFGNTPEPHTGRVALIWKVIPGENATTEALAVEQAVVSYGANNTVQTTTYLGQPTPSLTASDYRILLLGPTVNRQTDLQVEADYLYVGRVAGVGPGNTPTQFDTSEQNDLQSGFAVDLNEITRLGPGNDLKIRVRATSLDVDEPQMEVQNAGGTRVWTVDEDGDVESSGTVQHARAGFGDAPDATAVLRAKGESQLTDKTTVGEDLAASAVASAETPRFEFASPNLTPSYNLISRQTISGTDVSIYTRNVPRGYAIVLGASYQQATDDWLLSGATAVKLELQGGGVDKLLISYHQAATANPVGVSAWEKEHEFDLGADLLTMFGTVLAGNLWTAQTEGMNPRFKADHGEGNNFITSLFESLVHGAAVKNHQYRLLVWGADAASTVERYAIGVGVNCNYTPGTGLWSKAETPAPGFALVLEFDPATDSAFVKLLFRTGGLVGTWNDNGWTNEYSWALPTAGNPTRNIITVSDLRIASSGTQSADGGNPVIGEGLTNVIVPKLVPKAWCRIDWTGINTFTVVDGVNVDVGTLLVTTTHVNIQPVNDVSNQAASALRGTLMGDDSALGAVWKLSCRSFGGLWRFAYVQLSPFAILDPTAANLGAHSVILEWLGAQ